MRVAVLCQEALPACASRAGPRSGWASRSTTAGSTWPASSRAKSEQVTVIGRNVNLAGRLSSAAKRPMEDDEFTDPGEAVRPLPRRSVTVGPDGALFNEGIALSRAAFVQVEGLVKMEEVYQGPVRNHRDDSGRRSCCATPETPASRESGPPSPCSRSSPGWPGRERASLHSLEVPLRDVHGQA